MPQGSGTIQNDDTPLLVISQLYGGGGNAGATFKHDFIEIYNRGTSTVDLTGWSVQYNSAAGSGNWSVHTSLPNRKLSYSAGTFLPRAGKSRQRWHRRICRRLTRPEQSP
jgi:predicted extracellular nuclease